MNTRINYSNDREKKYIYTSSTILQGDMSIAVTGQGRMGVGFGHRKGVGENPSQ